MHSGFRSEVASVVAAGRGCAHSAGFKAACENSGATDEVALESKVAVQSNRMAVGLSKRTEVWLLLLEDILGGDRV
jgi:hypothetical protein